MNILLDTHALLWWAENPAKLPAKVAKTIASPANSVSVSIASYWEISIKASLNKLTIGGDILAMQSAAETDSIGMLPISIQAVIHVLQLPHHHNDPFDRIIAATALTGGYTLVSADPLFDPYGVTRIW